MNILLSHFVDTAFANKTLTDILSAFPAALKGITTAQVEILEERFGIGSIRELAESPFFRAALALLEASTSSYDSGPQTDWNSFFQQAPLSDYQAYNVPSTNPVFRTEFGPVFYRGRLNGTARVMLIGQDPSTDELLAARAFVGQSGQRIQGFLKKLGLCHSYLMVNTFLYCIHGQFTKKIQLISLEEPILSYRNALFNRIAGSNPLQAVITIGTAAHHAYNNWEHPPDVPVFHIVHPSASESAIMPSWNQALPQLIAVVTPDEGLTPDSTPYGAQFQPGDEIEIPRDDLPFGIPSWHGTGGTRSARSGNNKITWTAP